MATNNARTPSQTTTNMGAKPLVKMGEWGPLETLVDGGVTTHLQVSEAV